MISIARIYQFSATFLALTLVFVLLSYSASASDKLVNINSALAEELAEKLSGVGPAKAHAIVTYRQLHGPFKTVDELTRVKGIGPRTLEKNRAHLTVQASSSLLMGHSAIAPVASGNAAALKTERQTRRAVRSVIEAALRDSGRP